jgi:tetratricopeptide (TPR) repeat protein
MQDLRKGNELANRYTLDRKLGGGGMAETWLATDRITRASVALKILADERFGAESLRREWQTSIRLMHAHIVRVFEFHDDPVRPFYSLQYIDGPDISVMSGAPPAHVFPAFALLADALRYAHGKGLVHRDIKAANVLLDRNGAPYLIDFGSASRQGGTAQGGSLIAATPQSLAGEAPQAADDIFALGGLIYELVAGRSPYGSRTTADDIRNKVAEPLRAANGGTVPAGLQALVERMLNKDAGQRPTAEEVVSELAEAGIRPGPVPASYVARRARQAEEVIEAAGEVHARKRAASAAPPVAAPAASGLSPKTVGVSLFVLLLLLVGVVFILPTTVDSERDQAPAVPAADAGADASRSREKSGVGFTENVEDLSGRDERVVARAETDAVLGELLSKMETLEKRAVQRWGGLRFRQAQAVYAAGDEGYLARNYAAAIDKYREAIDILDPLLDEVDDVFALTYGDALAALEAADAGEALRLFELAVAISPGNAAARNGFERAKNLGTVLGLVDQGLLLEKNLEFDAALESFERAVDLDPAWGPARDGLGRLQSTVLQRDFDQRMTEGLMALGAGDYPSARAAFEAAQKLRPGSPEPADGLLQVDQGVRLNRIAALEYEARQQETNEEWQTAVGTYESILEIDGTLLFAQDGVARAQRMAALYQRVEEYIDEPDRLSAPTTMRSATQLVVDITRMDEVGPRLGNLRDELSRLLKRAATPLAVQLVSDNMTDVSVYKVGKLGSFATRELSLRPGSYVAVGSRPGYRDVRVEFRVGPEIEAGPVIVRCEEPI